MEEKLPVLVGHTSDEGTLFTMQAKPGEYIETTKLRFGPIPDKVLKLYPSGTEDITRKSNSALTFLLKSNGAYHGSDCAYVFGHRDQNPAMKYTA